MFEKSVIIAKQFGGKEDLLTLFTFIVLFFLLNSVIKRKISRLLISICSALFITLQLISLYFTQSFIGYQFFLHFSLYEIYSLLNLYFFKIILAILFLTTLTIFNFASPKLFDLSIFRYMNKNLVIKMVIFPIMIGLIFIVYTTGEFLTDTKSLWTSLATVVNKDNPFLFKEILYKHHMEDYVSPDQIKCGESKKNIVVISLESLERSFLRGKFATLTPTLQKLKQNWNYVDVEQNHGSEWTSGSLYTSLTGFPAYFGRDCNDIFHKTFDSKISSISHVLKKANHATVFINGDANFSGIKEMLTVLKFDKIIDKYNAKVSGTHSKYGLRDKEVFELAKKEVALLKTNNQPFTLYISTTDTHFPNGIYDPRMEQYISKKKTDLEFMVAAVDYLVGDFIAFLEKKELLSKTAVFIFPDHLKMGDPTIFEDSKQRGLYMITNSNIEDIKNDSKSKLYQLDLPKLILHGAGIMHNLKFYTDFIKGDKNDYLAKNIDEITEINTSGLSRFE